MSHLEMLNRIRLKLGEFRPPENGMATRRASLLIPLQIQSDTVKLLLTKRSNNLRSHSGQVSFPGGKQESSDELVALGRPVFMYFFASWCPTCRKDLAELATIYPEFSDHMDFIVIGQDPTESLTSLMSYRDNQRHPWPVALPSTRMLTELRITSQSF